MTETAQAVTAGLDKAATLAPGNGWATLGAEWTAAQKWQAVAEVGERTNWGEAFARGYYSGDAGGVGVGVRW